MSDDVTDVVAMIATSAAEVASSPANNVAAMTATTAAKRSSPTN
jgi:hypothetical protein